MENILNSEALSVLVDTIDKIKTGHADALIFVGGDFNGKNMTPLVSAFADLEPLEAGVTRRGKALDEIYTNLRTKTKSKAILPPLSKANGVLSDHSIIAATFMMPKHKKSTAVRFKFRPVTECGMKILGEKLISTDWTLIHSESASESAVLFNNLLKTLVELSFPMKERTVRSTDAPWFTPKVRKLVARKQRIYRAEGKVLDTN